MNSIRMLINYLDTSNILVLLTATLIIIVTYLLFSSDVSIFSEESSITNRKIPAENSAENLKKEEEVNKSKEEENKSQKVEMKGFQQNKLKEKNGGFELGNKTENIEHLSQKINNINNKNDEMGIMFLEGLSSLNSWQSEEIGKEIFRKIEWNLEKRQNDENGVVYQYVFPHIKDNSNNNTNNNNNLASSQESINSLTETEDGEEDKERQILSSYKLGICKIFEKEKNVKSNIVKKMNDIYYKIYSEGDPELIKSICRRETIPENYDEIISKNNTEGNKIMSICGKKMKMTFLQSQRIERNKCESNMTFLGFVFYKTYTEGHNPGYS